LQIRNDDGYRAVAGRAAALGFDGKWVLHPGQVEASNEIFSPSQEDAGGLRPRRASPGKIDKMGYKGVDTTELIMDGLRVPSRACF
jgi:hypothetical protein